MTFDEAEQECIRMNALAKEYWADKDKWKFSEIRIADPSAPSDGYEIAYGIYGAYRDEDKVYLCMPGCLAGDGRCRNEDGSLYVVTEADLNSDHWRVYEQNYSEW